MKKQQNKTEMKEINSRLLVIDYYSLELHKNNERPIKVKKYFNDKGFSDETLKHFKIGYDTRWIYEGEERLNVDCYILFYSICPLAYNIIPIEDVSKDNMYNGILRYPNSNYKIYNNQSYTIEDFSVSDKVIISETYFDMMALYEVKKKPTDFSSVAVNSIANLHKLANRLYLLDVFKEKTFYILLKNNEMSKNKAVELKEKLSSYGLNAINITDDFYSNRLKDVATCHSVLSDDKKKLQNKLYKILKERVNND